MSGGMIGFSSAISLAIRSASSASIALISTRSSAGGPEALVIRDADPLFVAPHQDEEMVVEGGPRRARCLHRGDERLLARDGAGPPRRCREGLPTVLLRGTKRKTRFRTAPIVGPAQKSLIALALEHASGAGGALFLPWANVRRDLADACTAAKIEWCGPNDRLRTFASWQVGAGVTLFPIAQAMAHKDTRMLERVYGRQTPEQLAALMARDGPDAGCL